MVMQNSTTSPHGGKYSTNRLDLRRCILIENSEFLRTRKVCRIPCLIQLHKYAFKLQTLGQSRLACYDSFVAYQRILIGIFPSQLIELSAILDVQSRDSIRPRDAVFLLLRIPFFTPVRMKEGARACSQELVHGVLLD